MTEYDEKPATGVSRTLRLLTALAANADDGLSIRQAAELSGISRSAVHRMLTSMAELGAVQMTETGRCSPGPLFYQWSTQLTNGSRLIRRADLAMRRLSAEFDESVYLARFIPREMHVLFIHGIECAQPLRYILRIGASSPLYAGAAGKAVLAQLPDRILETLTIEAWTDSTLSDLAQLRADLGECRRRNFSVSIGERFEDAAGIASPVFEGNSVVGSLAFTIPRVRFDGRRIDELGRAVARAATDLSKSLAGNNLSDEPIS